MHCLASPSLKLKGLAQARRSRSGESPSPRRGLKKEQENNAGSRLGETPLALARYSLAQNNELVASATFRVKRVWASPCPSRLGKTGSLGRDYRVSTMTTKAILDKGGKD